MFVIITLVLTYHMVMNYIYIYIRYSMTKELYRSYITV
jgi:hypothetical protein